jgi:fumarylacetoacetate (FAA) hydrolase
MKLCMFSPRGLDLDRGWPGRIDGDTVVQLAAQTLQAFFTGGGGAREHAAHRLGDCVLRAPVLYPPAIRAFGPLQRRATPFFEFRSPFPVLGPDDELRYPEGTSELGLGPGLAAVIGADGALGGFTLANAWTARDLARAERAAGFGPSKSGDFGLSLGPVLVTPDEEVGRTLVARVNGEVRAAQELDGLVGVWPRLVERAALNTTLRPGDLLLASVPAPDVLLEPGDSVELDLAGIGTLRTGVRR